MEERDCSCYKEKMTQNNSLFFYHLNKPVSHSSHIEMMHFYYYFSLSLFKLNCCCTFGTFWTVHARITGQNTGAHVNQNKPVPCRSNPVNLKIASNVLSTANHTRSLHTHSHTHSRTLVIFTRFTAPAPRLFSPSASPSSGANLQKTGVC